MKRGKRLTNRIGGALQWKNTLQVLKEIIVLIDKIHFVDEPWQEPGT